MIQDYLVCVGTLARLAKDDSIRAALLGSENEGGIYRASPQRFASSRIERATRQLGFFRRRLRAIERTPLARR